MTTQRQVVIRTERSNDYWSPGWDITEDILGHRVTGEDAAINGHFAIPREAEQAWLTFTAQRIHDEQHVAVFHRKRSGDEGHLIIIKHIPNADGMAYRDQHYQQINYCLTGCRVFVSIHKALGVPLGDPIFIKCEHQ